MSVGTILLIVLLLVLIGVFPGWGYHNYGHAPMGIIGVILVIVLVLVLLGRL